MTGHQELHCRRGGLLSVALSLGSPPPDFFRHRVSVEPGLSSPCRLSALAKRGRPANWCGFPIRDDDKLPTEYRSGSDANQNSEERRREIDRVTLALQCALIPETCAKATDFIGALRTGTTAGSQNGHTA